MKEFCDFCGNCAQPTITTNEYEVCGDCLDSILENEAERRGEREERRRFELYHSGAPSPDDIERQQLKDAGRIR